MSKCPDAEQTFICSRGPSRAVYTRRASGMLVAALGWFRCFPSWLARPRPRLMVDWTRKVSAEICREAVKLSASLPAPQLSCDWQRWTNRWLHGPVLTTVSEALTSLDSAALFFLCHRQINSFLFLNSGKVKNVLTKTPFLCLQLWNIQLPREHSLKSLFRFRGGRNNLFILLQTFKYLLQLPSLTTVWFLDELLYLQQQFKDK